MKPRQKVGSAALELIKGHEGLRRAAARLPDGRWTLGYGHTRSAREGATVSAEDAEALLLYDLRPVATAVNASVFAPLTQNQFDALVAFAFNVGVPAFRTSNVLRRVNAGEPLQAASALDTWRRAEFEGEPQVIDALVRRRAAEKALFLTPADGPVPVPSPVLPPRMDYGLGVLEEPALELTAPLDGDPAPIRTAPAPSRPQPATGSPTVAAADAAVERLQTLFPAARPPGAAPLPEVQAEPSPPRARVVFEDDDLARRLAPPSQEPATLAPPSPVTPPPDLAPADLAPTPEPPHAEPGAERWPYIGLFLAGAVLFVAGVSNSMRMDGFSALGLVMSLAGVACIGVSVYFLLKRIDSEE